MINHSFQYGNWFILRILFSEMNVSHIFQSIFARTFRMLVLQKFIQIEIKFLNLRLWQIYFLYSKDCTSESYLIESDTESYFYANVCVRVMEDPAACFDGKLNLYLSVCWNPLYEASPTKPSANFLSVPVRTRSSTPRWLLYPEAFELNRCRLRLTEKPLPRRFFPNFTDSYNDSLKTDFYVVQLIFLSCKNKIKLKCFY